MRVMMQLSKLSFHCFDLLQRQVKARWTLLLQTSNQQTFYSHFPDYALIYLDLVGLSGGRGIPFLRFRDEDAAAKGLRTWLNVHLRCQFEVEWPVKIPGWLMNVYGSISLYISHVCKLRRAKPRPPPVKWTSIHLSRLDCRVSTNPHNHL